MYKIASVGLLGLIAILVIPTGTQSMTSDGFNIYGEATMTYNDVFGNEKLSQTIHNQLFDQGEDFIIANTFTGITDLASDSTQIGAICLTTSTSAESYAETITNSTFNSDHNATEGGSDDEKNCRTDGTVTNSTQIATIGPLTFQAGTGTDNLNAGETIQAIGICDADSGDNDVRGCQNILFAVVDTSDVTLSSGETVDITYTFNLQSSGS